MSKIIYIEADGVRHELEVKDGLSVMEGAVLVVRLPEEQI